MKKTITTLALAGTVLLAASPTALATHVDDRSQDRAGAGTLNCRPGPQDHDLVGSWTLYEKAEFVSHAQALVDPAWDDYEYIVNVLIPQSTDATWAFCDKNRDGRLCVLTTEPSPYLYTLLDNRPFPG